jgi:hypothetical protein
MDLSREESIPTSNTLFTHRLLLQLLFQFHFSAHYRFSLCTKRSNKYAIIRNVKKIATKMPMSIPLFFESKPLLSMAAAPYSLYSNSFTTNASNPYQKYDVCTAHFAAEGRSKNHQSLHQKPTIF